jgi:AmmeMemoRadiSam system protein A
MEKGEGGDFHPLVLLARRAIESIVRHGVKFVPADDNGKADRAGVFVSIKKGGQLRGCIGTLQPVTGSLAEEVVQNSISAATRDPRFPPVSVDELEDLDISVDVLTAPEPVTDISGLDPFRYGVIVRSGGRAGVLLPDLPGIDTVDEQVDIARRKAGIGSEEPIEILRFEVKRHR